MKRTIITALAALSLALASCSGCNDGSEADASSSRSASEESQTSSESSYDDDFVPYAVPSTERITEYHITGPEVTYEQRAYLKFRKGSDKQYIVNFDYEEGIVIGFSAGPGSSGNSYLHIGTEEGLFVCDSKSHFLITWHLAVLDIYFKDAFLKIPKEVFFDLTLVEDGHLVLTSTLVLYPFALPDEEGSIYRWRMDEIGGYSFPKVDGEYQSITEEHTKPFFQKVRDEAKGKYYPGVIDGTTQIEQYD